MTPTEKLDAEEKRIAIFNSAGWICEVCGKSINHYGIPQLAHRIPNKKHLLKKYGKEIIHHKFNLAPVCCLKCNDSVIIEQNITERELLIDKILDDMKK